MVFQTPSLCPSPETEWLQSLQGGRRQKELPNQPGLSRGVCGISLWVWWELGWGRVTGRDSE